MSAVQAKHQQTASGHCTSLLQQMDIISVTKTVLWLHAATVVGTYWKKYSKCATGSLLATGAQLKPLVPYAGSQHACGNTHREVGAWIWSIRHTLSVDSKQALMIQQYNAGHGHVSNQGRSNDYMRHLVSKWKHCSKCRQWSAPSLLKDFAGSDFWDLSPWHRALQAHWILGCSHYVCLLFVVPLTGLPSQTLLAVLQVTVRDLQGWLCCSQVPAIDPVASFHGIRVTFLQLFQVADQRTDWLADHLTATHRMQSLMQVIQGATYV